CTTLLPTAILTTLSLHDALPILLRVWQRRGLFVSDRNNLSHRLVRLGIRPTRAVVLLWLLALVGGVGGLLIYVVPSPMKILLGTDRKSTRLNSSHVAISYAVFWL